MGIINEEIYTGLGGMAIKYYENIGYEIPKKINKQGNLTVSKGTKIKVKVSDLTDNSNEYIEVECDECKKKYKMRYSKYNKNNIDGKIYCKKCANKVLNGGENNYAWNKSKTQEERENGRKIEGYADFIKKVLVRDNYVCKCCGDENNTNLEVHHLEGYDWCKEKRTDETNGITLCESCHKNFHLIYGYGDNTKQQFEEWIGHAIELLKFDGDLPTTRKIICLETEEIFNNAIDLKDKWNIKSKSSIYEVCNHKIKKDKKGSFYKCNSIKGKHLLYLDEYLSMNKIELAEYFKDCNKKKPPKKEVYYNSKQVICITTSKLFNSIKEASVYYNIKTSSNIMLCCQGKRNYCGRLEDGTKLTWMYYEDLTK